MDINAFQKEERSKLNCYGKRYSVLLTITMISSVPLFIWLGTWAYIPWGIFLFISLYYAWKIEEIKKRNDIQTYKEVKAFLKGIVLDNTEKQKEIVKRPYEKIFIVSGFVIITVAASALIGLLMHRFLQ